MCVPSGEASLRDIAGALGVETQPENSKQYSMPSSKFNKHAELRNDFSVG